LENELVRDPLQSQIDCAARCVALLIGVKVLLT
jgi:hypothetical protein